MKHLKKIFETWSEPYTLDFQDHGFDLEEQGQKLKGKYQGKFVMSDLNTWYAELVDRLNDEWKVTQSKHSFNTASDKASFEIEIIDKESSAFFTILKDGVELKLYPLSFMNIYISRDNLNITLRCKLENGSRTVFMIYYTNNDAINQIYDGERPSSVYFSLGNKIRGIDFINNQVEGFINLIKDMKWENGNELSERDRIILNRILTGELSPCDLSLPEVIEKKGVWTRLATGGSGYIVNK